MPAMPVPHRNLAATTQTERFPVAMSAEGFGRSSLDAKGKAQGCGSKEPTLQTGTSTRRDSSCCSTPGSARLAMARFAHPGLEPVARFGAEEDAKVATPAEGFGPLSNEHLLLLLNPRIYLLRSGRNSRRISLREQTNFARWLYLQLGAITCKQKKHSV